MTRAIQLLRQSRKVVSGLNKLSNSFASERIAFGRYFSSKSVSPPHQISSTMTKFATLRKLSQKNLEDLKQLSKQQLEFQDLIGEFKREVDRMSELFDLLANRQ